MPRAPRTHPLRQLPREVAKRGVRCVRLGDEHHVQAPGFGSHRAKSLSKQPLHTAPYDRAADAAPDGETQARHRRVGPSPHEDHEQAAIKTHPGAKCPAEV